MTKINQNHLEIAKDFRSNPDLLRSITPYYQKKSPLVSALVRNPNTPIDILIKWARYAPSEFVLNESLIIHFMANPSLLNEIDNFTYLLLLNEPNCPDYLKDYAVNNGKVVFQNSQLKHHPETFIWEKFTFYKSTFLNNVFDNMILASCIFDQVTFDRSNSFSSPQYYSPFIYCKMTNITFNKIILPTNSLSFFNPKIKGITFIDCQALVSFNVHNGDKAPSIDDLDLSLKGCEIDRIDKSNTRLLLLLKLTE